MRWWRRAGSIGDRSWTGTIGAPGAGGRAWAWRAGARLLEPLRWMGLNAILVFFFHGTAEALIDGVFWTPAGKPVSDDRCDKHDHQALLRWLKRDVLCTWIANEVWCTFAYVMLKIAVWFAVCWYLQRIKYFWKI